MNRDSVPSPQPPPPRARMGKPGSPITVWPSGRGAKRARTADHGGSGSRDWTALGDGPASLIAERALAADVAAYVHFRTVCRLWRRCCDSPRACGGGVMEDPRFRPRQWIMLTDEAPHRCRRAFLNVSTGQCIQVDVPELRDHGVIRSTAADGLLFLRSTATGDVRLLNPLTRQVAQLPPITSLRTIYADHFRSKTVISAAGLADDRTVWLRFLGLMAFAKPGDKRWVLLDGVDIHDPMPNIFFAGRFYGVTRYAIMTLDMARGGGDLPPQLVVVAELHSSVRGTESKTLHLADNGGKKLLLVQRTFSRAFATIGGGHKRTYRVHRVDLGARKVRTRGGVGLSLGGHAVFVGGSCAISVPPRVFPSIDANTIYPGLDFCERGGFQQIGAYRIRDRNTTSFGYDTSQPLPQPWSIADCLAAYVSGPAPAAR